ncbi:hypothetical protein ACRAWC_15635 [Leifsonia sp. L25]|uniref:hypothetical protein n=1 Tax=Actinomycetes TaxID=1760 RepID=UPI000EB53174
MFNGESKAFWLATVGDIIFTTVVAGFVVDGGVGRLRRRFGVTCDGLRVVDLVTAERPISVDGRE